MKKKHERVLICLVTLFMSFFMLNSDSYLVNAAGNPTSWNDSVNGSSGEWILGEGDVLDLTASSLSSDAGGKIIKVIGKTATIKGDTEKTFNNMSIEICGSGNLTIENLNITNTSFDRAPIAATDGSDNRLIISGTNNMEGGLYPSNLSSYAAVSVESGNALTIDSANGGILNANGAFKAAGIGGNGGASDFYTGIGGSGSSAGDIKITGGTINTKGGALAAGIGGGAGGFGFAMSSVGGTGYPGGPGGTGGSGGTVTIEGGTVNATGIVAIGGGNGGQGGTASDYFNPKKGGNGGSGGAGGAVIMSGGTLNAVGIVGAGGFGGLGGKGVWNGPSGADGTAGATGEVTISGTASVEAVAQDSSPIVGLKSTTLPIMEGEFSKLPAADASVVLTGGSPENNNTVQIPVNYNFFAATVKSAGSYTGSTSDGRTLIKRDASVNTAYDLSANELKKFENLELAHMVTFDSKGGTDPGSIYVAENEPVPFPAPPAKEGFEFGGWYVDTDCTTLWSSESRVTQNMTLYAAWLTPVTINTAIDGELKNITGNVELKNGTAAYTLTGTAGVYTTKALKGTYDVYIDGKDIGEDIIVDDSSINKTFDFYTVNYEASSSGTSTGSSISASSDGAAVQSGDLILGGKDIVFTASGNGAMDYEYNWTAYTAPSHSSTLDLGGGAGNGTITVSSLSSYLDVKCNVNGLGLKPSSWSDSINGSSGDWVLKNGDTLDLTHTALIDNAGGKTIKAESGNVTIKSDSAKSINNMAIEISGGAQVTIDNLNLRNNSFAKSPVIAADNNANNKLIVSGENIIASSMDSLPAIKVETDKYLETESYHEGTLTAISKTAKAVEGSSASLPVLSCKLEESPSGDTSVSVEGGSSYNARTVNIPAGHMYFAVSVGSAGMYTAENGTDKLITEDLQGTFNLMAAGVHYFELQAGHKVTIDYKDGSPLQEYYDTHGSKINKPSLTARTGYTFDDWYVSSGGTDAKWDFDNDTVTEDVQLFVKWTADPRITINMADECGTFTVTGGTSLGNGVYTAKIGDIITINASPKPGYEFVGWQDSLNNPVTTQSSYTFTVDADETYTADFVAALKIPSLSLAPDIKNGGLKYVITPALGETNHIEGYKIQLYGSDATTIVGTEITTSSYTGNIPLSADVTAGSKYRATVKAVGDTSCGSIDSPYSSICAETEASAVLDFGSISGTITDGSNPVQGAVVSIAEYNCSATTDDDGNYVINDVPAGANYTVTAAKEYKRGTASSVIVTKDKTTSGVDIVLTEFSLNIPLELDNRTEESISLKEIVTDLYTVEYSYITENETEEELSGRWQSSTLFEGLSPGTGYKFYARVKADDITEPSAPSQGIYIYTLQSAPMSTDASIDYMSEAITFTDNYEVNTAEDFGTEGIYISSGSSIASLIGNEASTIYIRKKADGNAPPSAATSITIPPRQEIPSTDEVVLNYTDETLTFGTEIEVNKSSTGQGDSVASGSIVSLIPPSDASSELILYAYKPATNVSFRSNNLSITIPGRPAFSVLPSTSESNRKAATITLDTIPGAEYRLYNGTDYSDWTDNREFTGLAPDTEYTFEARAKAGAASFAALPTSNTIRTKLKEAPTVTVTSDKPLGCLTYGESAVITASAEGDGGAKPKGQIQFIINGTDFGSPADLVNGTATITAGVEQLTSGAINFTAKYIPALDENIFDESASSIYTLTVNKREVTVRADNMSIYVGSAIPEASSLTYKVTGLIGGDVLKKNPTLTLDPNAAANKAGVYTIEVTGAQVHDNYSITMINGTLTVKSKPAPTPTPAPTPPTPATPQVEVIEVPVEIGDDDSGLSPIKIPMSQTTLADGTANVQLELSEQQANEVVDSTLQNNEASVSIRIPQISGTTTSEIGVTIPQSSMDKLGQNNIKLVIDTDKAELELPPETVAAIEEGGASFTIKDVKDTTEIEQTKGVLLQVSSGGTLFTQPLIISSSLTKPVKITIPFDSTKLPTDPAELQALLDNMAVLAEHSDGENKVDKGTIVYDKSGKPIGISITVTKFSTFTAVNLGTPSFDGETTTIESKVMQDKEWTIDLNVELDAETINNANIYVNDYLGNKVDVSVTQGGDSIVKVAPKEYYSPDSIYYLCIMNDVKSKTGKALEKSLRYKFQTVDYELQGQKFAENTGVTSDKEWTIRFNQSIDDTLLDSDSIYVLNEDGSRFDIKPEKLTDDRLIVKPTDKYLGGKTYYLIINKVTSKSGKLIKAPLWMKFTINEMGASAFDEADEIITVSVK